MYMNIFNLGIAVNMMERSSDTSNYSYVIHFLNLLVNIVVLIIKRW